MSVFQQNDGSINKQIGKRNNKKGVYAHKQEISCNTSISD